MPEESLFVGAGGLSGIQCFFLHFFFVHFSCLDVDLLLCSIAPHIPPGREDGKVKGDDRGGVRHEIEIRQALCPECVKAKVILEQLDPL